MGESKRPRDADDPPARPGPSARGSDPREGDPRASEEDAAPAHPVPVEDTLDLHAFHPRDIATVVEEYLWEAQRAGLQEVRIIHGKGLGVQRRIVAALLARHPAVAAVAPAPADRGHYGATLVRLRPAGEYGHS